MLGIHGRIMDGVELASPGLFDRFFFRPRCFTPAIKCGRLCILSKGWLKKLAALNSSTVFSCSTQSTATTYPDMGFRTIKTDSVPFFCRGTDCASVHIDPSFIAPRENSGTLNAR